MRLFAFVFPAFVLLGRSTASEAVDQHAASQLKPRRKGHFLYIPADEADDMREQLKLGRLRSKRSKYFRHRRVPVARKHSRASLVSSGADVEPMQSTIYADSKPPPMRSPSDVFEGSHPLIGRELGAMEGELKLLRGQRDATETEGQQLKDSAQKAFDGLNGGASARRKITGAKAAIKVEDEMIEKLENEEDHLKQEHDHVWSNLHRNMEPRIAVRQQQLRSSQVRLEKTEKDVQKWGLTSQDRKASALQSIKQRKSALQDVQAAEEAVKQANLAEAIAEKSYKESNKKVGQQVQALKLAQTKLRAAQSTEFTDQEQVSQGEIALDRTRGILKAEETRLDKALSSTRLRLDRRIEHAKATRSKAERLLNKAKDSFDSWKGEQTQHSQEVEQKKASYDDKRLAYETKRDEVLKLAADKAGTRATVESPWNNADWAWSGGGEWGDDDAAMVQVP